MAPTQTCTNRGCGKQFDPDLDDDDDQMECMFHPGAPVFHEGVKGWSCCKKRVTEFDEFMKIPGCTPGIHTSQAQALPAPTKSATELAGAAASAKAVNEHVPVAPAPSPSLHVAAPAPAAPAEPDDDPEGTVVPVDTSCKRSGCTHKTQHIESEEGPQSCRFHSGEPIFHEGSKGWSCCSRKVLEFSEFLKIPGCKTGRHRYLAPPPVRTGTTAEAVDCRFDWYQTQTHVIISFFAKKLNKDASKVTFESQMMTVNLVFDNESVYNRAFRLFQPIQPGESNRSFMSVKTEVSLRKGNGITWAALEETNEPIKVWTTFGTTGKVGTVGAKEFHVAGDSPLLVQQQQQQQPRQPSTST